MGANTALTFVCFAILSFHIWSSSGEELAKRSLGIQCATATFPRANRYCRAVRLRELQRKQQFFKISGPERNHGFLHLDQPRTRILSYFLTEKFHSHWFNLYFTLMLGRSNSIIVPYLRMKYSKTIFTSYENYTRLAKEMKDVMLAATNYLPQFKYPSRSYNYFTDLLANDRFKRDDFFTQQRLAGLNPMAIRRVVHQGAAGTKIRGLLDRLNTKDFDWDLAIISVTKDRNMYEVCMLL